MSQFTVDHVQRMKHIKASLDNTEESDDAIQQKQDLLEELMDIVDNIDYARGKQAMSTACAWHLSSWGAAHACPISSIE